MKLKTINLDKNGCILIVTLSRIERQNSINEDMLIDLNEVLDIAEKDDEIKAVIIKGERGYFCKGMDFELLLRPEEFNLDDNGEKFAGLYSDVLNRISTLSKIVVSYVNGDVMAGGVGIVVASDIVVSEEISKFTLSEILWGLLPAIVIPYLIRRVGYQKAYYLTLTARTMSALEAVQIHLVDEIANNIDEYIRTMSQKLNRIEVESIREAKNFFKNMWIISEEMKEYSLEESIRLFSKERVQENIENFILYKKFPWNKK